MHRTNPHSLRSCPCFQVFRLNFASDFFDLLLVKFHQTEIIVVNIGATRGGLWGLKQTWGNRNVISNRLQLITFFSVIVIDY